MNVRTITILLYFLLVYIFVSAQTPDRTVGFTTPIPGVPNDSSITSAIATATAPATIWIAVGTYQEDELHIPAGITLIGGFPTNATDIHQRMYPGNSIKENQTVLDGNYEHRVATVSGILDGCIITKGYAYDETDSIPINGAGGGVLIDGGIVQNSIIYGNAAAEKSPTPGTIPGTFTASIGDIYCTDGSILQPVYSLNTSGDIIATLEGGIPAGKVPQGIVFYVDPSPTSGSFYVMGKVSPTSIQSWTNPRLDISGLANLNNINLAYQDFNGRENTDAIVADVQSNTNYNVIQYAYEYNIPSGTAGEWHLPAAGTLYKLWEVHPQMNACARDILGWVTSGQTMFPNGFYWSSSESNKNNAWGLDAYSYPWSWDLSTTSKTAPGYSIPVSKKSNSTE